MNCHWCSGLAVKFIITTDWPTFASESLGVPRNSAIQDCANASQSEASNLFHRSSIGIGEPRRRTTPLIVHIADRRSQCGIDAEIDYPSASCSPHLILDMRHAI